jgi:hypothetical protein
MSFFFGKSDKEKLYGVKPEPERKSLFKRVSNVFLKKEPKLNNIIGEQIQKKENERIREEELKTKSRSKDPNNPTTYTSINDKRNPDFGMNFFSPKKKAESQEKYLSSESKERENYERNKKIAYGFDGFSNPHAIPNQEDPVHAEANYPELADAEYINNSDTKEKYDLDNESSNKTKGGKINKKNKTKFNKSKKIKNKKIKKTKSKKSKK